MYMQLRAPQKPTLYRHPHGITAIDAAYLYPGHAAAHLIVDNGHAAFVDVGTNSSVPYLLAALDELGIARAAVDYLLLTHVHLDHAGGAGALTRCTCSVSPKRVDTSRLPSASQSRKVAPRDCW